MLRNKAAVLRSCAAFALLQVLLIRCWKHAFYLIYLKLFCWQLLCMSLSVCQFFLQILLQA